MGKFYVVTEHINEYCLCPGDVLIQPIDGPYNKFKDEYDTTVILDEDNREKIVMLSEVLRKWL